MKKFIYILLIVFAFGACDEGFDEMNVDPNNAAQLSPDITLTSAQLFTGGYDYTTFLFQIGGVMMTNIQQINMTSYRWEYTSGQDNRLFEEQYGHSVRSIVDLIDLLENGEVTPSTETNLAIANVMKVFIFSRLTDSYGDIPYFEGGKGTVEGIVFPKYDEQSVIYADMLSILDDASKALNSAEAVSSFGPADLIYKGDVVKWRKFANSLMLRLAMRMVKVDPASAESWATKAIDGGVMESNDDNAFFQYEAEANYGIFGSTINPITRTFSSRHGPQVKMSDTFVNYMKDRNDPRVSVLCSTTEGKTDFALQFGQPNIDRTKPAANSKPNMNIFGGLEGWSWYKKVYDAPFFFQTYAEVELMLAEAAYRWTIGGDAKDHYDKGVTAAMTYLKTYEISEAVDGGAATITQDQIDAYLAENPFGSEDELKMINEQYWVATFGNGVESFANWRRSGYPVLTPVAHLFSQTDGSIPRRATYPGKEKANNTANVQEAIDRQGDDLTTRMWWDK